MEHALDLLIRGHADVIDIVAVPVINLNAIDGIILRILGEVDIAAVTVHALLHQAGILAGVECDFIEVSIQDGEIIIAADADGILIFFSVALSGVERSILFRVISSANAGIALSVKHTARMITAIR